MVGVKISIQREPMDILLLIIREAINFSLLKSSEIGAKISAVNI